MTVIVPGPRLSVALGTVWGVEGPGPNLLERVRKLLAKAEDASVTPAEAEALTAKAAELMARYGIERALLAAARPEDGPPAGRAGQRAALPVRAAPGGHREAGARVRLQLGPGADRGAVHLLADPDGPRAGRDPGAAPRPQPAGLAAQLAAGLLQRGDLPGPGGRAAGGQRRHRPRRRRRHLDRAGACRPVGGGPPARCGGLPGDAEGERADIGGRRVRPGSGRALTS